MTLAAVRATANRSDIPALPHGVRLTTLDHNGLTIIVREDHSALGHDRQCA